MTDPSETPIETTIVTMAFDTTDPASLVAILAKYIVVSRMHDGCRNIDLCASLGHEGRFVLISKWASPAAQQAHFDSADMVDMAQACTGLLRQPPVIDLLEGLSAHDLA